MARVVLFAVCALVAGCGSVASDADAPTGSDGPGGTDASTARCNPTADFETPTLVAGLNTSLDETGLALTRDERIAFVGRTNNPGPQTLRVATRETVAEDFGPATEHPVLAALNDAAGSEYGASPSVDGLLVYFHRQTPTVIGIQVATRPGPLTPFDPSTSVTVDGPALTDALTPVLSSDGQTLYWLDFQVFRLHSATRGTTPAIFTGARDASTIDNVYNPVLSADELTLYSSNGAGTDILAATRADKSSRFGAGAPVDGVNSAANDWPVYLTADGCVLYLASARPGGLGGMDIWVARRGN